MTRIERLAAALRASPGFAHKRDIGDVLAAFDRHLPGGRAAMAQGVGVGDDCAALPEPGGEGHLLLAIEGLLAGFTERAPWFAGYCGVMVNVSDVFAMGGRPIAVVDAVWSRGAAGAAEIVAGMAAAAARYGVPVVGGHTNQQSAGSQLAVAVLGRARRLLSSFDARPGDRLLMAVDLRGRWEHPDAYWNASTEAPAERLRGDLELLPCLAEDGLCAAAKDISMAGAIGTALMLLECSRVGASIDLDAMPRPAGTQSEAEWLKWLGAFPSYGFLLAVHADAAPEALRRFHARGLACADIGQVRADPRVLLRQGGDEALLWNTAHEPFMLGEAQAQAKSEAVHA